MYKKTIFSVLSLLLLLTACKREEMVGDKVFVVSSNPLLPNTKLTVNNSAPDFSVSNKKTGTALFFAAAFSTDVSWKIVINGSASRATREIKGVGKSINLSNSAWEGDASSVVFFQKGDSCTASLYVLGIDTAIASTHLVIKKMLSYKNRTVDNVRYLLVDDFDGNHGGTAGMTAASADVQDAALSYFIGNEQRINGSNCFHMEGTDVNNKGWVFSMNHYALVEMVSAYLDSNIAATSEENFYINLYIRGTGKVNSAVAVKLLEYDYAKTREQLRDTITKQGFVFTPSVVKTCDAWVCSIPVNWEGWRLVSIPYSRFKADNNLTAGGNGNRVKEPWKITSMAVSLLSDPAFGSSVAVDIDFVVLSEGGPFVPKY